MMYVSRVVVPAPRKEFITPKKGNAKASSITRQPAIKRFLLFFFAWCPWEQLGFNMSRSVDVTYATPQSRTQAA